MSRILANSSRNNRLGAQRTAGPREAILRRHAASGSKRINVGKSVGSFVPKLAQKSFEKYGFSTVTLLTDWTAIVGQELARFARPEKLKWPRKVSACEDAVAGCQGRPAAMLLLRVEPARALEVEYGAAGIVERINSYFGYRAVGEIRLLQAPLDIDASSSLPAPCQKGQYSGNTGEGQAARCGVVDDLLAGVADEKLRLSLQKLQAGLARVPLR